MHGKSFIDHELDHLERTFKIDDELDKLGKTGIYSDVFNIEKEEIPSFIKNIRNEATNSCKDVLTLSVFIKNIIDSGKKILTKFINGKEWD